MAFVDPIEAAASPINASHGSADSVAGAAVMVPPPASSSEASCPTCSAAGPASFVYALGRIEPRFPRQDLEKEFAQATARTETKGKTDRETFRTVLARPEHRYLTRQLCWLFKVQGIDTYLLRPRDPADLDLLVSGVKGPGDPEPWLSAVIGRRGGVAPPDLCNGLMVPVVWFDQIYSFDQASLIKAIPRPERVAAREFAASSTELFERIVQLADNAGAADEHRAINYLTLRYPDIYARTADCHARDVSLTAVDTRASRLSGVRTIVDVIFVYTHRVTEATEKYFVRVDVTEEFPFLVTKLQPYYDR